MDQEVRFKRIFKYAYTVILDNQPFYGSLLHYIPVEFVDNPQYGDYYFTKGQKEIHFSKKYMIENDIKAEHFATLLLSMLINYGNMHGLRSNEKGNQNIRFAIAAKFCANSEIQQDIKPNSNLSPRNFSKNSLFKFREDALLNDDFNNKSAEEIYDDLPEIPNITVSFDDKGNIEIFSPDVKLTPEDIDRIKQSMSVIVNSDTTKKETSDIIENLIKASHSSRMRGNTPDSIEKLINELTEPKIHWSSVLQDYIENFAYDYDFMEADRRMMANPQFSRLVLPTLNGEKIKLAFAYDTSGSMKEKELADAMTESFQIIKSFPNSEMYVLSCDAEVHGIEKIENSSQLENYKLKGGGGTSFVPVFDYLEEENIDINILLYFTDGEGEYPIQEQHNFKTIWLMVSDVEPPFGRKIKYNS